MPLAELLQIYGMVPNSCVDIVVGSQRTPVVDDPLDYCGKSQRQAIKNLREMAQVSSKMIPFLYQAMLRYVQQWTCIVCYTNKSSTYLCSYRNNITLYFKFEHTCTYLMSVLS